MNKLIKNYKKAIITGINGQDAAYLAEFLLAKGYQVIGTYRSSSSVNFWRLEELGVKNNSNLKLVISDISDAGSCHRLIERYEPDEIYHLAAQSFVGASFDQPHDAMNINFLGALNILEAIRNLNSKIKFYQASSSEMYGNSSSIPINQVTSFDPKSPYAISKLASHFLTLQYRESYNIFATSGILFNHESPLRGLNFVSRKISDGVAKIKLGLIEHIELGNLNAKRDWGYAKDYVEGIWLMMQHHKPDTYILATKRTESVRFFTEKAFNVAGIDIKFVGEGEEEVGINAETGKIILKVSPQYFRPVDVDFLLGDPEKARNDIKWQSKTSLESLIKMMVEADLARNISGRVF